MEKRILTLTILIVLISGQTSMARDDFQYWSQLSLKPYKSEKMDFIIFTEARIMQDAEKLGLYFVSPRIIYHYSKNLDLGMNYTYLQSRKTSPAAVDDSYNWQHRAEVEMNPYWTLTDWLKLKMRNRFEFRWIEDKGSDNTRYRQRWTFDIPVSNNDFLKSVYVSSEFFYDFNSRDYKENRTVPLGLNIKVNDQVGFNLFYMIQSQKGTNDWSSNQIIGSLLSMAF